MKRREYIHIYKRASLHTCMINNRELNCISIEISPISRSRTNGEGEEVEDWAEFPEQYLPYNRCFVMSPWHFCEALADARLSLVHTGIHASCTARFALSSCCVYVQTVSCLDHDRPNVKRNFTACLRAIALSLPDTPWCVYRNCYCISCGIR